MSAKKFELPDVPTIYKLEVVVMPNGEILCAGKSLGYTSKLGEREVTNPVCRVSKFDTFQPIQNCDYRDWRGIPAWHGSSSR